MDQDSSSFSCSSWLHLYRQVFVELKLRTGANKYEEENHQKSKFLSKAIRTTEQLKSLRSKNQSINNEILEGGFIKQCCWNHQKSIKPVKGNIKSIIKIKCIDTVRKVGIKQWKSHLPSSCLVNSFSNEISWEWCFKCFFIFKWIMDLCIGHTGKIKAAWLVQFTQILFNEVWWEVSLLYVATYLKIIDFSFGQPFCKTRLPYIALVHDKNCQKIIALKFITVADLQIYMYELPSTFKPAVKHFWDSSKNSSICFRRDCNVIHTGKEFLS